MTPETVTLIAVLLVGVFVGTRVEKFLASLRREAWKRKRGYDKPDDWRKGQGKPVGGRPKHDTLPDKSRDAADQLRIVMAANFTNQPLLNKSEARVFKELDRMVIERNSAWQVMAQVSLGEILRCQDKDAYFCINAKRVDLLLVDGDCQARHAIEYQGGGHHHKDGAAAARDAVKKEALRKAGIGYHEVVAGHTTPSELKRLVEKLVPAE